MKSLLAVILLALLGGVQALASGEPDADVARYRGVREVVVKAQFLDVDVTGSDSANVEIAAEPDATPGMRQEQVFGTLNVWVAQSWLPSPRGEKALRLRLPQGIRVRVETISGDVHVKGLSAGVCDVHTVSGAISLDQVQGEIRAESVSGTIALLDTAGTVTAGTISGSIKGRLVAFLGDSAFSSVSGPVDIVSSSSLDSLRFDLASLSGRITVGHIGASRGLRMGLSGPLVKGRSVSGPIAFRDSKDPASD